MKRLAGRSVVITGSESGIGQAMAERCASEGAAVTVAGLQAQLCEEVAVGIRDGGGRAVAVPTDVRDQVQVEAAVNRTIEEFGGLYGVVANAGISRPLTPFVELTAEVWNETLATNLTG